MAQDDMDTEALLRDLEQRAQNGGGGGNAKPASGDSSAGGDEDIEAFLRELEGSDYEPPPEEAQAKPAATATKTREVDPLADELGAPQEAPDAPLAKPEKKVSARQQRKEEKRQAKEAEKAAKETAKKAKAADVQVVERGESAGLKTFVRIAKWSAIVVPILLAIWLLGAFLSSWVSASWLVAAVAAALVLLLPLAARLASKRGKYGWWAAGLSALLVAALVAPIPASAGRALERYGHWPATVIADLAGWSPDHVVVRAGAAVGSFVGQLIHPTIPTEKEVPRKLGNEQPLDPDAAPVVEPEAVPPTPPTPPVPTPPAPPTTGLP